MESNISKSAASSISLLGKEDKLRTKFKKKILDIRQCNIVQDTIWNVFFQGYEMLIKYMHKFPNTIFEFAVQLTETFKFFRTKCLTSNDIDNYEKTFLSFSPHLAQILTINAENIHWRSEFLDLWSEILSLLSNNILEITFSNQTEIVIIGIIQCIFYTGNYLTQLNGLELLLKYINSVNSQTQIEILNQIIPNVQLRKILLNFRLNSFDENSRLFLNTFNMKISEEIPVYSVVAQTGNIGTCVIRKPMISEQIKQPLWIDFNSLKQTISFFCSSTTFFPEQELTFNKKNWILVDIIVNNMTLMEDHLKIRVTTREKIKITPRSFEKKLQFNISEVDQFYFKFTKTNFNLIKKAKIVEFMNSKNQKYHTDIPIGFHIFQKDPSKKYLEEIPVKRITKNNKKILTEHIDNFTVKETVSNNNDNFSHLKSSIVVAETTPTSKNTSKIACKNISVGENPQKLQQKHLSRRESFESKLIKKCVVNLKQIKTINKSAEKEKIYNTPKINKDKNFKIDENYIEVIEQQNRSLKIIEQNNQDLIESEFEKSNVQSSIVGVQRPNKNIETSVINSSNRLVNLVHPLTKNSKYLKISQNNSNLPAFPITDNVEQLEEAVNEYLKNDGFIGITNQLKNENNRIKYTPEELDAVFNNIKEIDESAKRSAKRFFKHSTPEINVYGIENFLKRAPLPTQQKKRRRNADVKKNFYPNIENVNQHLSFSYKRDNVNRQNNKPINISPVNNANIKEKIDNWDQSISDEQKSQIYDLTGENNLENLNNKQATIKTTLEIANDQQLNIDKNVLSFNENSGIKINEQELNKKSLMKIQKKRQPQQKLKEGSIYSLASSIEYDSNKLIIDTSVSVAKNAQTNTNLIDKTQDEEIVNQVTKSVCNEISIKPNQQCDKTWLCDKFLNDVSGQINNSNKQKSLEYDNITSDSSNKSSIEPLRHEPLKINNTLAINLIPFNSTNDAEYTYDNISDKENEQNVYADDEVVPLALGQKDITFFPSPRYASSGKDNASDFVINKMPPNYNYEHWRSNNQQLEIIETRTKTVFIGDNNHKEARKVSLKRRISTKEIDNESNDDLDSNPLVEIKRHLNNLANKIKDEFKNAIEFPNEENFKDELEILLTSFQKFSKQYIESNNTMLHLRKKLKLEENICVDSLANSIKTLEKMSLKVQSQIHFYKDRTDKHESLLKKYLASYKHNSINIRQTVWTNYMNNVISNFVEGFQKFYDLDN